MPFGLLTRPRPAGPSAMSAPPPPQDHLQDSLTDDVAGPSIGTGVTAWAHKTFKTDKYKAHLAAEDQRKQAAMNRLTVDDLMRDHGELLREFMETEYTTENFDFLRDFQAGVDPQTLYTTYLVDRHALPGGGQSAKATNMVNIASGARFGLYTKGDAGTLTRADLEPAVKEIRQLSQQSVTRLVSSARFAPRLLARL